MMMARPTAASAAATVMTKKTNTCPATPYVWAKAMKVRFTALSISSTHMKMMIALRRVSTPTTPIVNRTAEKNRDSASIGGGVAARQRDRSYDGGEQQDARDLEREQIFVKQRSGHRRDRADRRDLLRRVVRREPERVRRLRARHRGNHREDRHTH